MNEGWQCPGCGRCYSPLIPMCSYCGNMETVPSTGTGTLTPETSPKPPWIITCGDQIIFKHNDIPYFQDMRMEAGIPNGVIFSVAEITKQNSIKITAPGFGALTPYYGNGAIYVEHNLLDLNTDQFTILKQEDRS